MLTTSSSRVLIDLLLKALGARDRLDRPRRAPEDTIDARHGPVIGQTTHIGPPIRDRDSMTQERIPVEGVTRLILDRLEAVREG